MSISVGGWVGVDLGVGVGVFLIYVPGSDVVGGVVGLSVGGGVGLLGVKEPLFCATIAKAAMLKAKLIVTIMQRNRVKGFITSQGAGRFNIVY
jgi:hypothetical protein